MPALYEFRPPWPPRAALIGPLRPPHAALIPIYWNLAWPVRLPLPIIPGINDRDVSLRWIRGKAAFQHEQGIADAVRGRGPRRRRGLRRSVRDNPVRDVRLRGVVAASGTGFMGTEGEPGCHSGLLAFRHAQVVFVLDGIVLGGVVALLGVGVDYAQGDPR